MGQTIIDENAQEFMSKYKLDNPIWVGLLDRRERAIANYLVSQKKLTKTKLDPSECGFEQGRDWSQEYFYCFVEVE